MKSIIFWRAKMVLETYKSYMWKYVVFFCEKYISDIQKLRKCVVTLIITIKIKRQLLIMSNHYCAQLSTDNKCWIHLNKSKYYVMLRISVIKFICKLNILKYTVNICCSKKDRKSKKIV